MESAILHLDMDSFFASCHQQGNPFLRGRAVAVVGNFRGNQASRSVIAAASKEAKKFGVTNGMPPFKAKKLCPEIILVEADGARYEYISKEVFKIMAKYGKNLKILSIDEGAISISSDYGEMTAANNYNYKTAKGIALKIKEEVKEKFGEYLTCSIGISYNYVLAKLASDLSKPNGLKIITKEDTSRLFKDLAIDKIAGIGEKTKEKLFSIGIKTFKDLQNASEYFLKLHFGIFGINLKNISLGADSFYYHREAQVKSIGHSETFVSDTTDKKLLYQYLQKLSEKVGFRLRQKNLEGNVICLTVRLQSFFTFSRQKKIGYYTFDGYDIFREAAKILDNLLIIESARLLGVSVLNLRRCCQDFLFEDMKKRKNFLGALDKIKKRYGRKKIFPLAIKKLLQ